MKIEEQDTNVTFRLSSNEKKNIKKAMRKNGFKNLSEYIRFIAINCQIQVKAEK